MIATESEHPRLRSLVVTDQQYMISSRKPDEVSVRELNLHSITNLSLCLIRFLLWERGCGGGFSRRLNECTGFNLFLTF